MSRIYIVPLRLESGIIASLEVSAKSKTGAWHIADAIVRMGVQIIGSEIVRL